MRRSEKFATPFTAATVAVPVRLPPLTFAPIVTVTTAVALVTVLPDASSIATATTGLIATPAVALLGWVVKASFTAGAGPGAIESVQAATTSQARRNHGAARREL